MFRCWRARRGSIVEGRRSPRLSAAPLLRGAVPQVRTVVGRLQGAGIALAWLDPAYRHTRLAAGVFAAGGGALIGAWLGSHAPDGLLALLTTIAGSAAAANLALIGPDASSIGLAPQTNQAPAPAELPVDPSRKGVPHA